MLRSQTRSGWRSRGEDAHRLPRFAVPGDLPAPCAPCGLPDPPRIRAWCADSPQRLPGARQCHQPAVRQMPEAERGVWCGQPATSERRGVPAATTGRHRKLYNCCERGRLAGCADSQTALSRVGGTVINPSLWKCPRLVLSSHLHRGAIRGLCVPLVGIERAHFVVIGPTGFSR